MAMKKVKKMQFGGDPTGNTMSEADMKRTRELMARTQTKEGGNAISDADLKKLREMLKGAGTAGIGKPLMKPQNKAMGGVVNTTKAMPVGMMDGGKVKKMNMGGVAKGRGGMFKGIR